MIRTEHLSRHFDGLKAVDDLCLEVPPGSIFGLIGPNGAGKTTTFRMLATLDQPTAGGAWVDGHSVSDEPEAIRPVIGYMPDSYGVYDRLTVRQYLHFFAAARRLPRSARTRIVDDVMELTDLASIADRPASVLSKGTKQRLCLAQILLHDPRLLILDEPAAGLDPRARIELRALLKELANMGKTILISSHILTELSDLCTHVGIIEQGRLLASGDLASVSRTVIPVRTIDVTVADRVDEAARLLGCLPGVVGLSILDNTIRIRYDGPPEHSHRLLKPLLERDIPVLSFGQQQREDLETLFLRITRGNIN
jgi:ABC-2 type transport system ATP-binding protein